MVKQLIEKQKAAGVSQQREEQQPANLQTSSSSPPPFLVPDALPTLNIGYPSLTSDVYHALHQARDRNKTNSSVYL